MAVGKIASFLSSLSPNKEATAAESMPEEAPERSAEALAEQHLSRQRREADPNHIAFQLQTMVGAVRALNETAAEQGAALALSPTGLQLKNAVIGLGHLLAAVDDQAMATGAAAPAREAAHAVQAVEASLAAAQSSSAKALQTLPSEQAERIRTLSDGFQREMHQALGRVHEALLGLRIT